MAKVLLTGATGFIGKKIYESLVQQGHDVLVTSSNTESSLTMRPGQNIIKADFASPTSWDSDFWKKIIERHHIEYVINNAGIINESDSAKFDAINFKAPTALADACADQRENFKGFIQISSVCTELPNYQQFGYSNSKHKTDAHLQALHASQRFPVAIIKANIVFGEEGFGHKGSIDDLSQLIPIPIGGEGTATFQPIHVNDLAKVTNLISTGALQNGNLPTVLHAVGPHEITCHDLLQLRRPQNSYFAHLHMPYDDLASLARDFPYGIANEMTLGMLKDQEAIQPFDKFDPKPFCDACGTTPDELTSIRSLPPQETRRLNVTTTCLGAVLSNPGKAIGPLLHTASRIPHGETRLGFRGSAAVEEYRAANQNRTTPPKETQGGMDR